MNQSHALSSGYKVQFRTGDLEPHAGKPETFHFQLTGRFCAVWIGSMDPETFQATILRKEVGSPPEWLTVNLREYMQETSLTRNKLFEPLPAKRVFDSLERTYQEIEAPR